MNNKWKRVDVQVSVLMIVLTILCTMSVHLVGYNLTYSDMIMGLEERIYAIYDSLEYNLDKSTFEDINEKTDAEKETYQEMKQLLEAVKSSTGVMYLYTAKKNDAGEFIYVIDGLSSQAEDFRYPGDLIEPEICGDMQQALDGEIVLPQEIVDSGWGKIFVAYFPIHDGDEVVGVLGIEIEAEHQYNTYRMLKFLMPVIILVCGLLATFTAWVVFRRISNPSYKDMSNTDHLTNLKNRNAFETDIQNMGKGKKHIGVGIMEADLNHLKQVNDRMGHAVGDAYIKTAGEIIEEAAVGQGIAYRMGGDEFAILLENTSEQEMEDLARQIDRSLQERSGEIAENISLSASIGYALYQEERDKNLMGLYNRADANMYKKKKLYYKINGRRKEDGFRKI